MPFATSGFIITPKLGVCETGSRPQTLVFDRANRLTQIPNVASYEYDGHGRRTSQWRADGTVRVSLYTLDGRLQGEADNRAVGSTDYMYLGSTLVAKRFQHWSGSPPVVTYQHSDGLGSPVLETDTNGAVVSRERFLSYGGAVDGAVNDTIGYTGHQEDPASGLVYMQQRYYDPVIGRFLAVDPMASDMKNGWNFNRFNYSANSPYRYTDPDGRAVTCADGYCIMTADSFESSRSNGQTTLASPAVRAKVESTKWKAKSEGTVENTYFVTSDRSGELRTHTPVNVDVKTRSGRAVNTARVPVPRDAVAMVHGHIEKGPESARGMVDVPAENGGYGDTQSLSLSNPIPTATVFDRQVGWHEISGGQLQFTYPDGALSSEQTLEMQMNLDIEQRRFHE